MTNEVGIWFDDSLSGSQISIGELVAYPNNTVEAAVRYPVGGLAGTRTYWKPTDVTLVAWTDDPDLTAGSYTVPSQRLFMAKVHLDDPAVATGVALNILTGGGTPTSYGMGLLYATNLLVFGSAMPYVNGVEVPIGGPVPGASVNASTSAGWTVSSGGTPTLFPFAAPLLLIAGDYYIAFYANNSPALSRGNGSAVQNEASATLGVTRLLQTSATVTAFPTAPVTGVLALTQAFWAAIY